MIRKVLSYTLSGALFFALSGLSTAASAETSWQSHHPRRAEINHRLAHQNRRINAARRDGDLSRAQARDIRAEDRGLRGQERLDASRDGGHITGAEQAQLNHEENGVSRQIPH